MECQDVLLWKRISTRPRLPDTPGQVRLRLYRASAGLFHGSLPVLPTVGEGDPTQTARQHDAESHYDGNTEADQRLGPCQGYEECPHRHKRVPIQKSKT